MKILVQIAHPAHVHFYKNIIYGLKERGDSVLVTVRDKDLSAELLHRIGIPHYKISKLSGKRITALEHLSYGYNTYKVVRAFQPDVITGIGGITAAHISFITDSESYIFTDSENATIQNRLAFPFADRIFTPDCYPETLGDKQISYPGYHELAYLHPNQFEPDKTVLEANGIDPDSRFSVLRFVDWGAVHDVGKRGFTRRQQRRLVDVLSKYGPVYITSEGSLPTEFEEYRLPVGPADIHHLLGFANLYVGDSGTMATEAAVLGTPAIRLRSADKRVDLSNFFELENRYGLLFSTRDFETVISKAQWIASDDTFQRKWDKRREALLQDKIDVTQFVIKSLTEPHRGDGMSDPTVHRPYTVE